MAIIRMKKGRKYREKKKRSYFRRKNRRINKNLSQRTKRKQFVNKKIKLRRHEGRIQRKVEEEKKAWFENNQEVLVAPKDCRLLTNTLECANFFRNLLEEKNAFPVDHNAKRLFICLKDIEYIDFASIMMLNAINEELSAKRCYVCGDFPIKQECQKYLEESSFYSKMYNKNGQKIVSPEHSHIIKVETGEDKIKREKITRFIKLMRETGLHLLGTEDYDFKYYMSLLKEICGNSVEWGNIRRKNWTIGVKFEDNKVLFCALDLGQGILRSLQRRFPAHASDLFHHRGNDDVLLRVFDKYYGSSSMDINRNQGLPFIKKLSEQNYIKDLHVITNNAYISFADNSKCEFSDSMNCFVGTLYSWYVDTTCIQSNPVD